MSVRSIVDIDLNDAKFVKFAQLFDKVQKQVAAMPAAWKAIGKEQGAATQHLERGGKALATQSNAVRGQLEEDKKRLGNLTLQEKLWQSMGKSSTLFFANVTGASKWLLKWGSLVGAGLLGGSLFGIDRLASRTSDARSSSMGLGMTIGAQKSFNLNFGRFFGGDASGFLSGVADAGADISKQSVFAGLGVNANLPTDQLALATLKALRARTLATPVNQLGILQSSLGLGNLTSVEDLRRIRGASSQEFGQQAGAFGRDQVGLDIAKDTARRLTDLNTQLSRAGEKIERTFIIGLDKAKIPEALSKLSDGFNKFLTTLLQSDMVKDALRDVTLWLNNFSGKLSAPEFIKNIETFTSDIGDLARVVHNVLHPIDALSNNKGATDAYVESLGDIDKRYNFPAGTMDRIFQTESGGKMFGVPVGTHGEKGPMQLMAATAAQYGVDPENPYAAANARGTQLADLERHYKGDIIKALAASNWGARNLVDYLRNNKNPDWARGLPQQVQNYLAHTAITIKFIDTPGSSTPVVASQLAGLGPG
jgi:hypothetical protein